MAVSDPFAGILAGETGTGKTMQLLMTLCTADCAYVAGPGGLRVGEKGLGFDPLPRTVRLPRPTLPLIRSAIDPLYARGFRKLGIDDLSLAVHNSYTDLEMRFPGARNTGPRWEALAAELRECFNVARASGMLVLANCHFKKGRFDKRRGGFLPGGPDLKGWEAMKLAPHIFDFVVIVEKDPAAFPFPAVFFCPGAGDLDVLTKDRSDVFHVARDRGPANLREYLRASGDVLPRIPGLEWQETVADKVCARILAGEAPRDVYVDVATKLRERIPTLQWIRWAIQDGIARAGYRAGPDCLALPPERKAPETPGISELFSSDDDEDEETPGVAADIAAGGSAL